MAASAWTSAFNGPERPRHTHTHTRTRPCWTDHRILSSPRKRVRTRSLLAPAQALFARSRNAHCPRAGTRGSDHHGTVRAILTGPTPSARRATGADAFLVSTASPRSVPPLGPGRAGPDRRPPNIRAGGPGRPFFPESRLGSQGPGLDVRAVRAVRAVSQTRKLRARAGHFPDSEAECLPLLSGNH